MVAGIELKSHYELFHIAHALDALGFEFRPAQGGQQERRQDGDNGDDDQQFDQRKATPGVGGARVRTGGPGQIGSKAAPVHAHRLHLIG